MSRIASERATPIYNYRALWWCSIVNEPVLISGDVRSCPICEWDDEDAEPGEFWSPSAIFMSQHSFLGNVSRNGL